MSIESNFFAAGSPQMPRLLHTMLRVRNVERSLAFYVGALGMQVFRRESYPEGRFTLIFVGYGEESASAVIELTHNWDNQTYQLGTAFGHIAIGVHNVHDVCEKLAAMQFRIIRPVGPMTFASSEGARDVIAFVEDPDGYRIELIALGS